MDLFIQDELNEIAKKNTIFKNNLITKPKKEKKKFTCYKCKQVKKEGNFRDNTDLICIECERLKYGYSKKLPKLKKKKQVTKNKVTFTSLKITGFAGIYKITCTVNQKVYIGESSNLRRRHQNYIKRNGYINPYLLQDINQYGIDKFLFNVLAVMKGSTKEERLSIEAAYKAQYSHDKLYNILPGIESKEAYQEWKEKQIDSTKQSVLT